MSGMSASGKLSSHRVREYGEWESVGKHKSEKHWQECQRTASRTTHHGAEAVGRAASLPNLKPETWAVKSWAGGIRGNGFPQLALAGIRLWSQAGKSLVTGHRVDYFLTIFWRRKCLSMSWDALAGILKRNTSETDSRSGCWGGWWRRLRGCGTDLYMTVGLSNVCKGGLWIVGHRALGRIFEEMWKWEEDKVVGLVRVEGLIAQRWDWEEGLLIPLEVGVFHAREECMSVEDGVIMMWKWERKLVWIKKKHKTSDARQAVLKTTVWTLSRTMTKETEIGQRLKQEGAE
ncbi:hypothetical protein EDB85DRAFT_1900418 [Lactarius pseudohatsudake]|nr:hypothetical protein EDB85DRAFT_1900418 [Lactarius pseudohatsudake]